MKFELNLSEIETLRIYQRNVAGTRQYVKVTCILMLSRGLSAETVSDSLGIDVSTVYRYRESYSKLGLDSFLENRHKGYWGLLSSQELSILRAELKTTLYTDSKSVVKFIKERFGVDYTPQGAVDLLNRIGFSYKKTKEVPCESDIDKQVSFMEELSKLFEGLDEKTVVYYADGVHPTHNSRSTYA